MGFWLQPVAHRKVTLHMKVQPHGCLPRGKGVLVDHRVPAAEMRRRWGALEQQGDPCAGDYCSYLGPWCKASRLV